MRIVVRQLRVWELVVFLTGLWFGPIILFLVLWLTGGIRHLTPEALAGLVLLAAPTAVAGSLIFILWRLGRPPQQ